MKKLNATTACSLLKTMSHGLCSGLGRREPGHMCVQAAVSYAFGLPHNDEPTCVGAAPTRFGISLNDAGWSSNMARAKGMKRFAIAQLGSNKLDQVEFAKRLAEQTIRRIVPIALRAEAKRSKHNSKQLEAAAVRCEVEGTQDAADAAADAASATLAARAAEHAASANYAAHDADDADDAASANYAADAAAAAAAAAANDAVLAMAADIAADVLVEMKSEGAKFLYLTEEGK